MFHTVAVVRIEIAASRIFVSRETGCFRYQLLLEGIVPSLSNLQRCKSMAKKVVVRRSGHVPIVFQVSLLHKLL